MNKIKTNIIIKKYSFLKFGLIKTNIGTDKLPRMELKEENLKKKKIISQDNTKTKPNKKFIQKCVQYNYPNDHKSPELLK